MIKTTKLVKHLRFCIYLFTIFEFDFLLRIDIFIYTMNDNQPSNVFWYVIKTYSRQEKKVALSLDNLGFTCFLPLEKNIKQWSDRKKKVSTPLIPSTLFLKESEKDLLEIYQIPGFHSVLKENGKIGKVTETEIEHLRMLTSSQISFTVHNAIQIQAGDEIEVISGPFKGYFGKAIEELNAFRVIIQVDTLSLAFAVNLAKNQVRKLK